MSETSPHAYPGLSREDACRDLTLIARRGKTWVDYQRDVWRLPLARQLYLDTRDRVVKLTNRCP